MARRKFTVENGIRMIAENGNPDSGVDLLFGAGAPGGDTGEQDDAIAGSIYFRTSAPYGAYKKTGTANNASDWEEVGNVSLDQLNWRNEKVVALTNATVVAANNVDPSAWFDNDDGFTPVVGQYIIGSANLVPALFEITLVTSPTDINIVAASQPIANNDTFVIQNYLPDPSGQENQAIYHVPVAGSAGIKIADIDWSFLDAINLNSPYVGTTNGTPVAGDSGQVAIGKLDANQRDLTTLSGEAQGAIDHGTFTGDIIPDNSTTHAALQSLETELVDTRDNVDDLITLSGVAENATDLGTFTGTTIPDNSTNKQAFQALESAVESVIVTGKATGITTATAVDFVLVDGYHKVAYEIVAWEEATPANKKHVRFECLHNGTASADATDTDSNAHTILGVGSVGGNFLQVSPSLTLTGASQRLNLVIASNTAGITVEWRRVAVPIQ